MVEIQSKTILIFYDKDIDSAVIIRVYLELCKANNIKCTSKDLALLTRSRIHKGTDIAGLWKSDDIQTLAKSAYEWHHGSRKKSFELCEKALFNLIIDDYKNIVFSISKEIENTMSYEIWRAYVVDVLCTFPSPSIGIADWVKKFRESFEQTLLKNQVFVRSGIVLKDKFKIKTRDKYTPLFNQIPLRDYFEVKLQTEITQSSIHGVKGESFDAVLMLIQNKSGSNTITPNFMDNGALDSELMRIAYVAMTRPRKLLVVAMPYVKSKKEFKRFPKDKWDYLHIKNDKL
jgi:hypothetical protein